MTGCYSTCDILEFSSDIRPWFIELFKQQDLKYLKDL